jgi:hypothetical protein
MLLKNKSIYQNKIIFFTIFFLFACREVDLCSSKIGNNRTIIESFPVDINDLKDSLGQTKIYTLNRDTTLVFYRKDDTISGNVYVDSYLAFGRNMINIDSIIAKSCCSFEENQWVDFANYNIKSKIFFSDSALVVYVIYGFESHNTVSLSQKFKPYILILKDETFQVVSLKGYSYSGVCGDFVIAKNNIYEVLTFDEKAKLIYIYNISNNNAVLLKKLKMSFAIEDSALRLSKKNYFRLSRIIK